MEGDFGGLHIAWEAQAHSGKRWNFDDDLAEPLTTSRGMFSADMQRIYPSLGRCLLAGMLANLSALARAYYPAEPRASAESIMTVFVYRLTHPEREDKEFAARAHIECRGSRASASIFMAEEKFAFIDSVHCEISDGVWDIVLRILRELFSSSR
ncbi:hypothetical protein AWB78_01361 [Caballeronia calidae]|uniref:Uncharacterized protein n=2 Tax=Caballeronia calidae TaxID=1777139 RepID=A0A158A9M3_9BURK|nr:hypothetical protein AWB78_01361 [Caballeronia calidae]